MSSQVAVVTGAGRGIGRAIACRLARTGATIVALGRTESSLASLVSEIQAQGGAAVAKVLDVAQPEQVTRVFQEILETYSRVDSLVNNAGITRDQLLLKMKTADFDAVLQTNLYGTFYATQAVYSHMMRQRKGAIVNVASVVGIMGNAGQANYAASKAGVIAFTKSVAKELGPRGVRVNAVAPGFIESDMTAHLPESVRQSVLEHTALKRLGQAEEVAEAVAFLLSDAASYITGQVLSVCGGMTS